MMASLARTVGKALPKRARPHMKSIFEYAADREDELRAVGKELFGRGYKQGAGTQSWKQRTPKPNFSSDTRNALAKFLTATVGSAAVGGVVGNCIGGGGCSGGKRK